MSNRDSVRARDIPRAKDHIKDPILDFCAMRWAWGKTSPEYRDDLLETGRSERNPLHEAYEEMADALNMLDAAIMLERNDEKKTALVVLRSNVKNVAEQLRHSCLVLSSSTS